MKKATHSLFVGHVLLFFSWLIFLLAVSSGVPLLGSGFWFLGLVVLLHVVIYRRQVSPWREIEKGVSLGFNVVNPTNEEVHHLKKNWLTRKNIFDEKLERYDREKAQLKSLMASMSDGLITLDIKGVISSLNPSAKNILSLKGKAIKGASLSSLLRSNELGALLSRLSHYEEPFETELKLYSGTLQEKTFQVKGSLFQEPVNDQHTLVVFTDVTQLRRLESTRNDFVGNVSHELKTPLTSVKGYAETLLNLEEIEGVPRRFLGKIANNAERLHQIIEDLLVLSSLEQDGIDREKMEKMSFKVIFNHLRGELSDEKKAKVFFEDEMSGSFLLHGPLLHLAVSNLIENALKYSKTERVEVKGLIDENGGFKIEVRDMGVGIPKEHLPHIMDRFYRIDKVRGRENGGTGLGLSIVKTIIEAHGGMVQLESEVGQGTTFLLLFPSDLNLTKSKS
mgnify:CR=1 FL=1